MSSRGILTTSTKPLVHGQAHLQDVSAYDFIVTNMLDAQLYQEEDEYHQQSHDILIPE
jgi:hypothetical protein